MQERVFQFDLRAEVEKFFDDSSVQAGGEPKLVVLIGATCSGKTFVRKRDYSKGYVVVDAAEVFLNLCAGERYEFGTIFGELVDGISYYVALRAMRERRNIVTEMTATHPEEVEAVCEAAVSVGYKVEALFVRCSLEDAQSRFLSRGAGEISASQTQPYHHRLVHGSGGEADGRGARVVMPPPAIG